MKLRISTIHIYWEKFTCRRFTNKKIIQHTLLLQLHPLFFVPVDSIDHAQYQHCGLPVQKTANKMNVVTTDPKFKHGGQQIDLCTFSLVNKQQNTCPSAMINRTWYCPPLCSTIVIAISMTGAKDVGPESKRLKLINNTACFLLKPEYK